MRWDDGLQCGYLRSRLIIGSNWITTEENIQNNNCMKAVEVQSFSVDWSVQLSAYNDSKRLSCVKVFRKYWDPTRALHFHKRDCWKWAYKRMYQTNAASQCFHDCGASEHLAGGCMSGCDDHTQRRIWCKQALPRPSWSHIRYSDSDINWALNWVALAPKFDCMYTRFTLQARNHLMVVIWALCVCLTTLRNSEQMRLTTAGYVQASAK